MLAIAATLITTATPAEAIVGGNRVNHNDYAWMVRLEFGCSGVLYAPQVVLTAAHCVSPGPASFTMIAGRADRQDPTAPQAEATYVHRPPAYEDPEKGQDWALIKLKKPLDLPTLPIAASTPNKGEELTVMGWGVLSETGSSSQRHLHAATVSLVDDGDCDRAYRNADYGFVSTQMLCAGRPEGGADACRGDSGGPIIRSDGPNGWAQVGIVSFGIGCGRPGFPGVYTELPAFADEISRAAATLP